MFKISGQRLSDFTCSNDFSDRAIGLRNIANVSMSSSDAAVVCLQLKGTYTYTYNVRLVIFINIEQETLRNLQWIELENLVLTKGKLVNSVRSDLVN